MNSQDLINSVSVTDILAAPTETRSFQQESTFDWQNEGNSDDFAPEPPIDIAQEQGPEFEEPYDARAEATKLVHLLNAGNSLAMTPLAHWKLKKNRGGRKALDRMKAAWSKKQEGKQLEEEDQKLLSEFEVYKTDIQILNGEIPFSEGQIQTLITCAIPYCEETKMKVNSSFAFWGVYGGMQIEKITKILTA